MSSTQSAHESGLVKSWEQVMDIFEEATDAIIHSVDSQDRSQAQDPPTYRHWLGSGWGKDS